ncbi:MAG: hypothetical protein KatS3mg070_0391 [Meiothermus sp.]|uniref:hypothetical protein n=1 Tax=Meiothermus sp. TaxID=1955249 RepID=UPI0021DE6937|nr:hypothetical protein [Meiothermus sp.]GIW27028.1 MAG: hypothetical protein KatS3mg070_0391 [Meiothermus sp.]
MLGKLIKKLRALHRGPALPAPSPEQTIQAHRIWLYLNQASLSRPRLTPPVPLSARTALELFLQWQGRKPVALLEVGFIRLKDRKALTLCHPGPLKPGRSLHLQYDGLELAARLGYGEALAPYVRTAEGRLYYEQPFVFEAELAAVAVPLKPRPQTLQGRAQPLGEPTVSRRFRP